MLRATRVIQRTDRVGRTATDTVTLDHEARYRRRVAMTSDNGIQFLLDLKDATHLAHGDLLELSDGGVIMIRAAAEDLMEIHVSEPRDLARIAWHIGNRHTPAEITEAAIYIKPDHVLAAMIAGLGGHVHVVRRPFEPERGAYGSDASSAAHHHHHGGSSHHDH